MQRYAILVPQIVIIGGLHHHPIVARRQIGIGGTVVAAGVYPCLVEALELVTQMILGRINVTQRREAQAEQIILMRQFDTLDTVERLGKSRITHLDHRVDHIELGERHRRHCLIRAYLIGIKRVKALNRTEIDAPARSLEPGIQHELIVGQSVKCRKQFRTAVDQRIPHKPVACREPQ